VRLNWAMPYGGKAYLGFGAERVVQGIARLGNGNA
jgi:hypothetical protein